MLEANSAGALPPTVRSRVLRFRFTPWREDQLDEALRDAGYADADAWLISAVAGGSPDYAQAWAETNLDVCREFFAWLEGVQSADPSDLLDFAEGFRGGEKGREHAELFIRVHCARARREADRAAQAGQHDSVSRWVDHFEAAQRARSELRRRNLNAQLVVEGLLFDLRASAPA